MILCDEAAGRALAPTGCFAGALWAVLAEEGVAVFFAGGFEEEDFTARPGDAAPRLDAADAADAFMLDTSFLVLLRIAIPSQARRASVTAPAMRRPADRLLRKKAPRPPRRAVSSPRSVKLYHEVGRPSFVRKQERACNRSDQPDAGSGENSSALPGLPFHSSASGGGSPFRVMFGQVPE